MNMLANTYMTADLASSQALNAMNTAKLQNQKEARAAAEDFEAFFLGRMAETMFEGISTDGPFGGGHAEKVYRSLLMNEYGKAMAKTGTVGVANYVMKSILEIQEAAGQEVL